MSDTFKHKNAGKAKRELKSALLEQGIEWEEGAPLPAEYLQTVSKNSRDYVEVHPQSRKNFSRPKPIQTRVRSVKKARRLKEKRLLKNGSYDIITPKRPQDDTKRLWAT